MRNNQKRQRGPFRRLAQRALFPALALMPVCTLLVAASTLHVGCKDEARPPAVAGKFYPEESQRLRRAVDSFLASAVPVKATKPVAIVVPHAGYIFSGQISADGFAQARGKQYELVVILGTNHTRAAFPQVALYPGRCFRTPLGEVPVDTDAMAALLAADPDCIAAAETHAQEHSIEVQLPFIQTLFPSAKILPLIVGSPDPELCRRLGLALAKVVKDRRTLLVASSDLSHYPTYEDAVAVDTETLRALAKLDVDTFLAAAHATHTPTVANLETAACGEAPILATIAAAKALGAHRGIVVSYANSGDTSVGERSHVVGYGAVVFAADAGQADTSALTRPPVPIGREAELTPQDKQELLAFARRTLTQFFESTTLPLARGYGPAAQVPRGVFVTLKKHGELRGCIGQMVPDAPLSTIVGRVVLQSAFQDPRFSPLALEELSELQIEISVLTPFREVPRAEDIVVGRDGVLLRKGERAAVFLPQVAPEQGWGREEMLAQLCRKAGLKPDDWHEGARFFTFQAVAFQEPVAP